MGFFEVLCGASGIPLSGAAKLVLVAETKPDGKAWQPISLPLSGTYNRVGSIDLPEKLDSHAKAIEKLCAGLAWDGEPDGTDLESSLSELNRCMNEDTWGRSNGRRVTFAIFDANVYKAMAKHGKAAGSTAELIAMALPIVDLREAIYGRLDKRAVDKLRASAVELVRFLASGVKLKPVNVIEAGQLCGYDVGPEMSAKPFLTKAKKQWAKHPEILAAIALNERHWRELDDEDD